MALAAPVALMALLWAVTFQQPPVAFATSGAGTVYAGCGGLTPAPTPNYATIQDAVDNVLPDGVVNICAGTYSETVNLNDMNFGSPGNITIRRNPASPGTVNWSSPDDALYTTGDFSGSVVLQDLTFTNAVRRGIDFAGDNDDTRHITGSVTISNVQIINNMGSGAYIRATGDITVQNSSFNNNGVAGLWVDHYIYFGNTSVNVIGTSTHDLIDNTQSNGNGSVGISIATDGNVTIVDTQAIQNGSLVTPTAEGSGIAVAPVDFFHPTAIDSADYLATGFLQVPSVLITNTDVMTNGGYGIVIQTAIANIAITDVNTLGNAYDGIAAEAGSDTPGTISLNNSHAEGNGWGDIAFAADFQAADLPDGVDLFTGFRLVGDIIKVDNAIAKANGDSGFCLDGFVDATIINSHADSHDDQGIVQHYLCSTIFDYYSNFSTDSLDLTSMVTTAGEVEVQNGVTGSFIISNTTASDNLGPGFEVVPDTQVVTLTNVTAKDNGTGILVNYGSVGSRGELDVNKLPSSYMPVLIDSSLIQGNTDRGVSFAEYYREIDSVGAIEVPATATIARNIICENGDGVVISETLLIPVGFIETEFVSEIGIDARGNWWGDASGPTPPGSGDTVISGTGIIRATPWINTFFTDTAPSQTIAGVPVDATFRFGDAGETYFLENGVGNLNDAPIFSISNSNGDIAAASTVDQFLKDTYLSVTITPSVAGSANVAVVGPCGLTPSIAVPVANPSIHVSKWPDLQGVPVGGAAAFTVTIFNTGDITLTEIAITDNLAPNCGRASGALSDLGPGKDTSYTCDLTVNNSLINTIQANAKALIDSEPVGSVISATDTASVKVGSLTLTRTVWVDGYDPACQTIDKSLVKVPSGTPVKYCFTVTNSGDYTFTTHSLNDSRLGEIFGGFPHDLAPGASYSNVDAGFPATETVTADITGITTWTGTLDGPIVELTPVSVAAVDLDQIATTVSRIVALSQTGDDQDNDGIDDITEGFGDVNANGVPDFLEFTPPTGEEEENQPGLPQTLLLPSLNR